MIQLFWDNGADALYWRSLAAFMTSLGLMFAVAPRCIAYLARLHQGGSTIREDVPEAHLKKTGTPGMGGIMIVGVIVASVFLWADWRNLNIVALVGMIIAFAVIGFLDDLVKIRHQSKGLSGKKRLILETIAALLFMAAIWTVQGQQAFELRFPYMRDVVLSLGLLMIPLAVLVIVGSANAVNLTDGLDGLAIFPVFVAAFCFGILGLVSGIPLLSGVLGMPWFPENIEVMVFCAAVMGACLGFLWFNAAPAQVFMGDTGSLALGGVLGCLSIITQSQLLWVIIGGVFVVETLSVMIQVFVFRRTGKRVFAMAPLHHHFEKKGWPEVKIVQRCWIIAIVLAFVGLSSIATTMAI